MVGTKSFMTVSSIAVALIFGGGVYLFMNFGSIAKNVTERVASDTLGVKVSIASLDVSLADKSASVKGLRIGNPDGFSKPHAMSIDNISVALNSVSRELLSFKDIEVGDTKVFLEVKEGGTNLQAIKDGMKTAPSEPKAEPKAEGEAAPLKVIIDRFALTNAQLHPSVTLLSEQDLKPIVVPDIILTGIGQKENGVLAREAIAQIWSQVAKTMNRAAGNAGFLQGLSADALKDMGLSQVEQIKDRVKGEISGGVEKITGGLKSLLGN